MTTGQAITGYITKHGARCRVCGAWGRARPTCGGWCARIANAFNLHHQARRYASGDWRNLILERDGFRCQYCGRGVTWETSQVDHVFPVHYKGLTLIQNLVTACTPCNQRKRATTFSVQTSLALRRGYCLADLPRQVQKAMIRVARHTRTKGIGGRIRQYQRAHGMLPRDW